MFEKIKGIRIKSSIFETETRLDLFEGTFEDRQGDKNDRASLLFGRNGAGKSTIARGVNQIKSGKGDASLVSFIDKENNAVVLDDENRNSIFVFDEDYVESKVKISQDGLDTIVIFDEQKDIDSQIEEIQKQLSSIESDHDLLRIERERRNNNNDEQSPEYWKKKISDSLKGIGNWAERDKDIKGNRTATPVHADTFKQFVDLDPTKSMAELGDVFNKKKDRYFSLKDNSASIIYRLEKVEIKFDYEKLSELLSRKVEEPELTSRDRYLLEILSDRSKGEQYLKGVRDFFLKADNKKCPYCTQDVSDVTRNELVDGISKLLSRAVEEHQQALQLEKISPVELDFSEYSQLSSDLIKLCQDKLEKLNNKLEIINSAIERKINNPYRTEELPKIDFSEELLSVNSTISDINQSIDLHNKEISDINELKKELFTINNEIAHYEIKESYNTYLDKTKQKQECESNYSKSEQKIDTLKQQITTLNNRKQSINIAVDEINKGLSYIFFSKERLSLENCNGKYFLLSRGKSVPPNKVSVGERNALALSYFFTEIIQRKELANAYNQEYFLVLDDPISSFDLENKIGTISYLKFCLNKFLSGNKNTRVLLTTHDVQTFYDFNKFLKEIMEHCKEKENRVSFYKCLELVNGNVKTYNIKSHGYTELLETVYDYATSTVNESGADLSKNYVGNAMRKILEAYGSFTYKQGIDKLTTDSAIIEKIEEKYREYFENLMYRLVLHGESHYEDPVKALNIDFFSSISDIERQKTARDLLVLLYLFDDLHVLIHLKNKSGAKEQLELWKSAIA